MADPMSKQNLMLKNLEIASYFMQLKLNSLKEKQTNPLIKIDGTNEILITISQCMEKLLSDLNQQEIQIVLQPIASLIQTTPLPMMPSLPIQSSTPQFSQTQNIPQQMRESIDVLSKTVQSLQIQQQTQYMELSGKLSQVGSRTNSPDRFYQTEQVQRSPNTNPDRFYQTEQISKNPAMMSELDFFTRKKDHSRSPTRISVTSIPIVKTPQEIPFFSESTLVTTEEDKKMLKRWLDMDNPETTLLYKGSKDGFKANTFHFLCDNKGPTISLIKSDYDKVFGAYTKVSFKSCDDLQMEADDTAFLFSVTNKTKHEPYANRERAVCNQTKCLLLFGKLNPDLAIYDNCNALAKSASYLGSTFNPLKLKYKSKEANSFLAGAEQFIVKEIEVYNVQESDIILTKSPQGKLKDYDFLYSSPPTRKPQPEAKTDYQKIYESKKYDIEDLKKRDADMAKQSPQVKEAYFRVHLSPLQ